MNRLLIIVFLTLCSGSVQSADIVWSPIQNSSKDHKSDPLILEGDYFYQIQQVQSKYCFKKIKRENLTTVDSTFLELEWNDEQFEIIREFNFGKHSWLYTKTHDELKGIVTTYIHLVETNNLTISSPWKVAEYKVPARISKYNVDIDYRANRFFSQNLMRVETSFLNGYCMTISCKDMVPVYSIKNAEKQEERIFETTFYADNFENKTVAQFRPPTPNFYIYQLEIDLDGSVYMLGQTISMGTDKIHHFPFEQLEGDLQIIKYNPESGAYISEIIYDVFPNLEDYQIQVDGGVTFLGRSIDRSNTIHSLVSATYNRKLIKTNSFIYELEDGLSDNMNSELEIRVFKFNYKKEYGNDPEKIPLINFDLIYSNQMDNGDLIFILEKQTSDRYRDTYRNLYGPLIIISLDQDGRHNWTKIIDKDQRSLGLIDIGVFAYSDGKNLCLLYNESDRLETLAKNPNAVNLNDKINSLRRIRALTIDSHGEIIENKPIEFSAKKPLLLDIYKCYEISPGVIILNAFNSKKKVFGSIKYF